MTPRHRKVALALALLATFGGASAVVWRQPGELPKRFSVVVEGRLYRSGRVTPLQLESLAREHGVQTVLSLLDPAVPESVAEHRAAERLGLRWLNLALPGDGASTPEQRERLKSILFDDAIGPLLVHCAAGANRTGLAVGLYRLHKQAWTLDQVLDEMRSLGFKDRPHHQNLRDALAAEAASVQPADP